MPEMHFTGYKRIVANPQYCDGQPRIQGTRITVAAVLSYIAGGMSVDQIAEEYPKLTSEDIYEALAFAAAHFNDRFIPLRLSSAGK